MAASNCRMANHIEMRPQRFAVLDLSFGFEETELTKGKLYGELRPVLKYNFKEQD